MRFTILIARDHADARAWKARQPFAPEALVIVTVRSPGAARGYTADAVLITEAAAQLPEGVRAQLLAHTMPSVATRR